MRDGCKPGATSAALAALAPYLEPRRYRAGQVLWTEGEAPGRLVLLERGRVKVIRALPDGRSLLLFVFGPGDLFGFLPFLDGEPYPATAVAVDEITAKAMSRSALRRAIRDDPEVAMILLAALGARLRQAMDRIGDQAQRGAMARVAAALTLLLPGDSADPATIIAVPRPLHAFAKDIGLTPETFSRTVSRLVESGVLHRLSSARLQVRDAARLRLIAAGRDDPADHHRKTDRT